jgi:hypothetical protein
MALPSRGRVGTITLAAGTVYDLRLAADRADAYQTVYQAAWPQQQDVVGTQKLADALTRTWHITKWSGGEGEDLWDAASAQYDTSSNVIPTPRGEGLILGPQNTTTTDDDTPPNTFADGVILAIIAGGLYATKDGSLHGWTPGTAVWGEAGTDTGGAAHLACSMCDAGVAGGKAYIGYADHNDIRTCIPGGANAEHYATGTFTYDPVVKVYDGHLYALDGDDLYEITAANTRVLVAETSSYGNNYLTSTPAQTYNRLCATDTGLAWYTVSDNGQCFLWEYLEAEDYARKVGKLPVDGVYPYSMFFASGYLFVAFRYASAHAQQGEAFIYYQRGGQRGIAGPVRNIAGATTASKPIVFAGMIGDDLFFTYNAGLWAYNLSAGSLVCHGVSLTTDATTGGTAITFGKDIFVGNMNAAGNVERWNTTAYTTAVASIDSGRWDFDYMGIRKVLLNVRAVFEPLPANTTITCAVSANGGAFTTLTGTATGDGALTTYVWAASSATGSIAGYDFEVRLLPKATAATVTPTIRSITAQATSGDKRRAWQIALHPSSVRTGSAGDNPRSSDILADLRAVAATGAPVLFTNPWEVEEWDAPSTHTVMIGDVSLTCSDPAFGENLVLTMWEVAYA